MFDEVDDLRVYQIANRVADIVWTEVDKWNHFQKQTIGRQITLSVDSIAANIAEGYGRFHSKDVVNFLYYARGSLQETKCWIQKAYNRSLLSRDKYEELSCEISTLAPQLNAFINKKKKRR